MLNDIDTSNPGMTPGLFGPQGVLLDLAVVMISLPIHFLIGPESHTAVPANLVLIFADLNGNTITKIDVACNSENECLFILYRFEINENELFGLYPNGINLFQNHQNRFLSTLLCVGEFCSWYV